MAVDNSKIIYLHGSQSNSRSGKAQEFARRFPGMVTPDFVGLFEEKMKQLTSILSHMTSWTIIGSSYGGLMAALFTAEHPEQVRKLVMLAPALTLSPFASRELNHVSVPTIVVHGTEDEVVPLMPVRALAEKVFTNLTYYIVEDGHRLHKALDVLDWERILD